MGYGSRLQIKHILSREERPEACFHGRINQDVLRQAFLEIEVPKQSMKFLAVGTTQMIDDAYGQFRELGLDIVKKEHWSGNNLLYRKCAASSACGERGSSPLLAATPKEASKIHQASDEEPSCKR